MWEFLEPCPPSNPDNYLDNPKYKRAVQTISMIHFNFLKPLLRNSRICDNSLPDKRGELVIQLVGPGGHHKRTVRDTNAIKMIEQYSQIGFNSRYRVHCHSNFMCSITKIENLKRQFNEDINFITLRKFVTSLVQKLKILGD